MGTVEKLRQAINSDGFKALLQAWAFGEAYGKHRGRLIKPIEDYLIEAISLSILSDRFHIEEILRRFEGNEAHAGKQFLAELMDEYLQDMPLTKGERQYYMKKYLNNDLSELAVIYFRKEEDLLKYLEELRGTQITK